MEEVGYRRASTAQLWRGGPPGPPQTLRQPLGLTVFPARSRETLPVEGALRGGG